MSEMNLDKLTVAEVIKQFKRMDTDELKILYAGYKHTPMFMISASTGLYNLIQLLKAEVEERETEGTYNTPLSRDIIRSGGTNADYPITLCESITTETKKQHWDTSYMIGKARVLIDFLTNEQNRANSLQQQGRTEEVIKQDKDWRERIAKEKDK